MGSLYNGTDKDYDFRDGTSTTPQWPTGGDTDVLDPGGKGDDFIPPPDVVEEPTPDVVVTPPPGDEDPTVSPPPPGDEDPTPPPGGGGGTTPPPTTGTGSSGTGAPDYSGEAAGIKGDGSMAYTIPPVGGVDTPMSSGTADPSMTPWEVTKEQTMMGLGEEYYDRDSPFFEQARQRAIRQHLAGGGQNSAMAAGFGELAAMDKAFQAASQDAITYAKSAEFNASMANQFSLAEQRFIHNAMLSDQAFDQAAALQTQRVHAQLESIVLDYKGRGILMDKELDQWFLKSKQEFAYTLGRIGAETDATLRVNSMTQLTNFYIAGFQSVMEAANNPNLTPAQSAAALREGMGYMAQQWQFLANFLSGYGNANGSSPYNWLGQGTFDPANWASNGA